MSNVSSEGEQSKDSLVAELEVKKKLRKRTIRIPLEIKDFSRGLNMRLSEKDIK